MTLPFSSSLVPFEENAPGLAIPEALHNPAHAHRPARGPHRGTALRRGSAGDGLARRRGRAGPGVDQPDRGDLPRVLLLRRLPHRPGGERGRSGLALGCGLRRGDGPGGPGPAAAAPGRQAALRPGHSHRASVLVRDHPLAPPRLVAGVAGAGPGRRGLCLRLPRPARPSGRHRRLHHLDPGGSRPWACCSWSPR